MTDRVASGLGSAKATGGEEVVPAEIKTRGADGVLEAKWLDCKSTGSEDGTDTV